MADMFPGELREAQLTQAALRAVEIYAARHPRPAHVSITQAAQMLDLSRNTVGKLVKTGGIRLNGCGLIPIEAVDALLRPAA